MNAVFLSDRKSDGKLFVGTSASTKLDKSAVRRNKMRRRCREALRNTTKKHSSASFESSLQLILTPKYSSLTCDFEELLKDSEALISHLIKYASK
jgi:ribonuclease P protein component